MFCVPLISLEQGENGGTGSFTEFEMLMLQFYTARNKL